MSSESRSRTPLAVGDRVRVYGCGIPSSSWEHPATITELVHPNQLQAEFDDGSSMPVHPKQCRRRVKRERRRRRRRRIWLNAGVDWSSGVKVHPTKPIDSPCDYVEFVEVRRVR